MNQIRYFVALVQELNFTRAAKLCQVAQPSLTRAIRNLEDELGGALFRRERANTHLTELGRMMRPRLERIWSEAEETKRLAASFGALARVRLKIGVTTSIEPDRLAKLFVRFLARHPAIDLEFVHGDSANLGARLLAGEIEAAFVDVAAAFTHSAARLKPLFRDRMMVVVSRTHPCAGQEAIRLTDMAGEVFLRGADDDGDMMLRNGIGARWAALPARHRCGRTDWLLEMIAGGRGYGLMSADRISHPGVVVRPMIEPELWREVGFATIRGRPHPPALAALVRQVECWDWGGAGAAEVEESDDRPCASSKREAAPRRTQADAVAAADQALDASRARHREACSF